jgi:hypothetical protein
VPQNRPHNVTKRDLFDKVTLVANTLVAAAALITALIAYYAWHTSVVNAQPQLQVLVYTDRVLPLPDRYTIQNSGETPMLDLRMTCFYRVGKQVVASFGNPPASPQTQPEVHRLSRGTTKDNSLNNCANAPLTKQGGLVLRPEDELYIYACYRDPSGQSFSDHWEFIYTRFGPTYEFGDDPVDQSDATLKRFQDNSRLGVCNGY